MNKIKPFRDRSSTIHKLTGSLSTHVLVSRLDETVSRKVASTNGMDTSKIDRYRQGVNITSLKQFHSCITYRISGNKFKDISSGSIMHEIDTRDFGQSRMFYTDAPFKEVVGKFTAEDFIHDNNTQEYPQIYFDVALKNPDQMDGVVEPFPLREMIANKSIEAPFQSRGVFASLQDGNLDRASGTDIVLQKIFLTGSLQIDPFIDSEEIIMKDKNTFKLQAPPISSDIDRKITPYADNRERFGDRLYALTGSESWGIVDYRQKSATAGFEYVNNENGTDSIAFGGLKR